LINGDKINKIPKKLKVLVAPLNWGLGHATRCIPIINELIFQNCDVFIAADGDSTAAALRADQRGAVCAATAHRAVTHGRRAGG